LLRRPMEEFEIVKISKGERETIKAAVTEEVPLTIEVNGDETATMLCSPEDLKDMVIGFLLTSGFIKGISSLRGLTIDRDLWKASAEVDPEGMQSVMFRKRIYTSGCGKGIIFHDPIDLIHRSALPGGFSIAAGRITELMRAFMRHSTEYRQTGGVHSAALADDTGLVVFRDDLGRHNAIDKVIGAALTAGIGFADKVMLTSGRISSEIVWKLIRCGIPVLASAKAPTDQAVRIARDGHLTTVGFARVSRMNIYSGTERIE
jgi:FdhD protein